jgi:hypothetical protein
MKIRDLRSSRTGYRAAGREARCIIGLGESNGDATHVGLLFVRRRNALCGSANPMRSSEFWVSRAREYERCVYAIQVFHARRCRCDRCDGYRRLLEVGRLLEFDRRLRDNRNDGCHGAGSRVIAGRFDEFIVDRG